MKISLESKIVKIIIKIISKTVNFIFFFSIFANAFTYIYNNVFRGSPEYFFAKNVLALENNITTLFVIVCVLSLCLNKFWIKIVWIIALWKLSGMFSILPEMQKVIKIDYCIDIGYVWDYNEKRCKNDCYNWNKDYGCIKMTEEQIKIQKNCIYNTKDCPKDKISKNICLNNNKAWNLNDNNCDFYFTKKNCHKLIGNWQYPSFCNSNN